MSGAFRRPFPGGPGTCWNVTLILPASRSAGDRSGWRGVRRGGGALGGGGLGRYGHAPLDRVNMALWLGEVENVAIVTWLC